MRSNGRLLMADRIGYLSGQVATLKHKDRNANRLFYYRVPWLKLRREYLAANPLCERCKHSGLTVLAEHVHHIIERAASPRLELEWSNLEALCESCHNKHTRARQAEATRGRA
jgi:5-methylcytosine-specific restriction endonuclease McrA